MLADARFAHAAQRPGEKNWLDDLYAALRDFWHRLFGPLDRLMGNSRLTTIVGIAVLVAVAAFLAIVIAAFLRRAVPRRVRSRDLPGAASALDADARTLLARALEAAAAGRHHDAAALLWASALRALDECGRVRFDPVAHAGRVAARRSRPELRCPCARRRRRALRRPRRRRGAGRADARRVRPHRHAGVKREYLVAGARAARAGRRVARRQPQPEPPAAATRASGDFSFGGYRAWYDLLAREGRPRRTFPPPPRRARRERDRYADRRLSRLTGPAIVWNAAERDALRAWVRARRTLVDVGADAARPTRTTSRASTCCSRRGRADRGAVARRLGGARCRR